MAIDKDSHTIYGVFDKTIGGEEFNFFGLGQAGLYVSALTGQTVARIY